jgi:hypothetical protein
MFTLPVSAFQKLKTNNHTLFTGGHFMMTPEGPHLNSGTIHSFEQAALLYLKAKKSHKHVGLGVLINDIGAVCSASSCSFSSLTLHDEIQIPDPYLKILETLNIQSHHVKIFREKHIRNRAKKLLHKELESGNQKIHLDEGGYVYREPTQQTPIILTRQTAHDKYGTPACPLIMSAFSMEQERQGYRSSVNLYYIGSDNYQNVANHYVIEKGGYLAEQLGAEIRMANIYLFDDEQIKCSGGGCDLF